MCVIDPEQIAEQDRGRGTGARRIEVEKENAEAERQGQHGADRDIAVAQAVAEDTDRRRRGEGEGQQTPERIDAEQDRAGRAGEADMRKRMTGEGQVAQYQEIPDRPGDDRDDAAGEKGGAHEVVVKHHAVPRRGDGLRSRTGHRQSRRRCAP